MGGLIIISILGVSGFYAKRIEKCLKQLEKVTEHIRNQDLNFKLQSMSIKEFNDVLFSLGQMQEALKEELEKQWEMEKQKKEQVGAIAHDIKTPLTIIQGNTELLLLESLDKQQEEYTQFILKNTHKIKNYLQNLLGRAIMNVIDNAIEHTPRHGQLTLEFGIQEHQFKISISDTGSGFNEKDLKYAKEQFYMNDESRGRKGHYGMGLYIEETLVKLHDGKMTLRNNEKGGAKVIIEISVKQ